MPGCCLMVATASAVLFRIKWRCVNQVFHVHRIFNSHHSHVWPEATPHAASVHWHQQCSAVNVWAGIVHDFDWALLVTLTSQCTDLLSVTGGKAIRNMWFQHDGAAAHYARQVSPPLTTITGLDGASLWLGHPSHRTSH